MFIAIMNDEDKEKLINMGHKYLYSYEVGENKVHIFDCANTLNFDSNNIKYTITNKLRF